TTRHRSACRQPWVLRGHRGARHSEHCPVARTADQGGIAGQPASPGHRPVGSSRLARSEELVGIVEIDPAGPEIDPNHVTIHHTTDRPPARGLRADMANTEAAGPTREPAIRYQGDRRRKW